jgi:hypothetical protein
MKFLLGISTACVICFLVGCTTSSSPEESISKDEYALMLSNARAILIENVHLTEKEKRIVMGTKPHMSVRNTFSSGGLFILNWQLENGKDITIHGDGIFAEKKSLRRVSLGFYQ